MDTDLSFKDYLAMCKRRWLAMLITFILVVAVALGFAFLMQPVYESKGTILIESQQISTDLMKANVNQVADERIEAIKQRVMTRENLFKLIETYKLFDGQRDKLSVTEMVDNVKNNISITALSANKGSGRSQATIAFSVSYSSNKPEHAFKITNDVITLFLSENAKDRTTNATETTEFFEKEGLRLKTELEEIEKRVAEFKQTNASSLPEYKDMNLTIIQRLDSSILDMDREIKSTQAELRYLDIELTAAKSGVGSNTFSGKPYGPNELDKLREEYAKFSVTYSDNHPTLKRLKSKIEALEKFEVAQKDNENVKESKEVIEAKLRVQKIEAEIATAKNRIDSLSEQKQKMLAEMSTLQQKVLSSPQVERELTALMRDYENAKAKYEEVKSKQLNSKMTVTLEQENKGERFVLIDPPTLPEKPSKPDRKKISVVGILAAIGLAIAMMIALETIDKRIRTEEQLTAILNIEPLVVFPYIKTFEEVENQRKLLFISAVVTTGVILLLLVTIHMLYMPLDVAFIKLMSKF